MREENRERISFKKGREKKEKPGRKKEKGGEKEGKRRKKEYDSHEYHPNRYLIGVFPTFTPKREEKKNKEGRRVKYTREKR